ncbi:La-related protein 6 [Hordeum vulgare]|nr:La-related protein 6 [Hordeum vulgare]
MVQLTRKVSEDIDYTIVPKASSLHARLFLYLKRAVYDIKLVNIDGSTHAMLQVKWSIGNASGSTTVCLFKGPATDLLHLAVMNLRSLYTIETLFSFSRVTFYYGSLGSLSPMLDLNDQEKGTHYSCYKVKKPICNIKASTLGTTHSKCKEPIHDK